MTVQVKDLVPTKILEPAPIVQYECKVASAIIDKITIFNPSAASVVVEITLNTVADSLLLPGVLMKKTLQPGEPYTCPEISGHGMVTGDQIITGTSAQVVIMRVSGREIS